MKTESEIQTAIAAFDEYIPLVEKMDISVAADLVLIRDSLAWTIGCPPRVRYPQIDFIVARAAERKRIQTQHKQN